MSSERELWATVLHRAVRDAAGDLDNISTSHRAYEQRKAQAWLGSRDFAEVCHLAGVDPAAVRDRLPEAIARIQRDVAARDKAQRGRAA